MTNARKIIVKALMHQEKNGYANLVLDGALKKANLLPQDSAFVSAIFYGTIERQNTLDYCLGCYIKGGKTGINKLDSSIRAILRSALYQLRYMSAVPASAAVNEAVNLTRIFHKGSAAGMVNAVLRRAAAIDLSKTEFSSKTERLSVLLSVSGSIAELMLKFYGEEAEEILAASFFEHNVTIRTNLIKNTQDELKKYLVDYGIQASPIRVPGGFRVHYKGNLSMHPGFQQGLFYIQGEASQIAALSLEPQPGDKVLDMCAAPGGKTLTLAGQMHNKGELYSCDAIFSRISLIERAIKRCGVVNAKVLLQDASKHNGCFEEADRVLCDVPCSGLGILGKKPDIRYKRLSEDGMENLKGLQFSILENSAMYLKPGGILVYSTCTINPEENTHIIKKFLSSHMDFTADNLPYIPDGAIVDDVRGITMLPNRCAMDGFYIARIRRRNK